MKTDASAVRIKYRIREKMIHIYKHGCQQNKIHFFPVLPVKDQSNKHGKNKMQEIMRERFQ